MLQHSQKQDEAARRAQMINTNSHPPHLNNDLNFKFQQIQNQVQVQIFLLIILNLLNLHRQYKYSCLNLHAQIMLCCI